MVSEAALKLPYYAATAWYHKMLPADLQQKDLTAMLPEVENFTINELLPVLSMGGFLDEAKKKPLQPKWRGIRGFLKKPFYKTT